MFLEILRVILLRTDAVMIKSLLHQHLIDKDVQVCDFLLNKNRIEKWFFSLIKRIAIVIQRVRYEHRVIHRQVLVIVGRVLMDWHVHIVTMNIGILHEFQLITILVASVDIHFC